MIIRCRGCERKFEFDDKRLPVSGHTVRCSKCGRIFRAYPNADASALKLPLIEQTGPENRKHPRVAVSIPALCRSVEPLGDGMDLCFLSDISKEGVALEIFQNDMPKVVSIFLISSGGQELQIRGKVAHSSATPSGKRKIGLSLLGAPEDVKRFVSKAAEAHRLKLMQTVPS
jgi:predicted Zn finger-like uncharacterized protein